MIIYDFFAGTGSATKAFEECGHTVIKVELDKQFQAQERDILGLTADYLITKYGKPDFIWASPPCTTFSVASIGKHWDLEKNPKTESAREGLALVAKTIELIKQLNPTIGYIIENPRGMLRKQPLLGMPTWTVSYCQYGETRMKPTDLWSNLKQWQPKPICKPKSSCHEPAPRGARTGTQGLKGSKIRSMIPYNLSCDVHHIVCDTPRSYA